ncbi:MAG: flagellar biosynthesis protein FlhB [Eubacterium sp.]|nr:flagellar biosynthesis protein FlhB [Eubacterium sp.]
MLDLDLQFFAAGGDGGEKTEEATPKKLEDARKEGQVAKSQDIGVAVLLTIFFAYMKIFGGMTSNRILGVFKYYYGHLDDYAFDFNVGRAMNALTFGGREMLIVSLPIMGMLLLGGFVANVYQVKWQPTMKPLQPKFSKLNPISGMKKLFSKDKLFELVKSVVKLIVLFYVVYTSLQDEWGLIVNIYRLDLIPAVSLVIDTVLNTGLKICVVFLIIAVVDYMYQKHKFRKDMRMSKQEVKDEYKNTEGNPQIKSRIRNKMMEVSRRRMMQSIPEADVVITNPTHLAVALKYDRDLAEAPIVLAKGADYLAEKIKNSAYDNNIEIVENKPLARMLYYNVELGDQIPPELYQMVAEILAYVYELQGKVS